MFWIFYKLISVMYNWNHNLSLNSTKINPADLMYTNHIFRDYFTNCHDTMLGLMMVKSHTLRQKKLWDSEDHTCLNRITCNICWDISVWIKVGDQLAPSRQPETCLAFLKMKVGPWVRQLKRLNCWPSWTVFMCVIVTSPPAHQAAMPPCLLSQLLG